MSKTNSSPNDVVQLCAWEFVQIRALCEEIMDNLCQAKALLAPINETDFFYSLSLSLYVYKPSSYVFRYEDTAIDNITGTKPQSPRE